MKKLAQTVCIIAMPFILSSCVTTSENAYAKNNPCYKDLSLLNSESNDTISEKFKDKFDTFITCFAGPVIPEEENKSGTTEKTEPKIKPNLSPELENLRHQMLLTALARFAKYNYSGKVGNVDYLKSRTELRNELSLKASGLLSDFIKTDTKLKELQSPATNDLFIDMPQTYAALKKYEFYDYLFTLGDAVKDSLEPSKLQFKEIIRSVRNLVAGVSKSNAKEAFGNILESVKSAIVIEEFSKTYSDDMKSQTTCLYQMGANKEPVDTDACRKVTSLMKTKAFNYTIAKQYWRARFVNSCQYLAELSGLDEAAKQCE